MPGFLTDLANNAVLDCLFGGVPIAPPPVLYLGLSLEGASKAGAVDEPAGGGYARVAVPNGPAMFPAASGGSKSNAAPIAFPDPTGDWGEVLSVFVADPAGNVLAAADLAAPKRVKAGDPAPKVATGALFLSHT